MQNAKLKHDAKHWIEKRKSIVSKKISKDIKDMKKKLMFLLPVDKTNSLYKLLIKDYHGWKVSGKKSSSFIKFDMVDFYPSISKDLLIKSIDFIQSITTIETKVVDTILDSRISLLFNKHSTWVKIENSNFDVTIGDFKWVEICKFVG